MRGVELYGLSNERKNKNSNGRTKFATRQVQNTQSILPWYTEKIQQ
jgi:hypothetical protein